MKSKFRIFAAFSIRFLSLGLFAGSVGSFLFAPKPLLSTQYCGFISRKGEYSMMVTVYKTPGGFAGREIGAVKVPFSSGLKLYTKVFVFQNSQKKWQINGTCDDFLGLAEIKYMLLKAGNGWKYAVLRKWSVVFGAENGSLLLSMLTGNCDLDEGVQETMKSIGLLHVVAISGVNIVYLQSLCKSITGKLRKKWRIVFDILVLSVLWMVVGDALSLVRAIVTFILGTIARINGIKLNGNSLFALTFGAMVIGLQDNWVSASNLLTGAACYGVFVAAPFVTHLFSRHIPRIFKEILQSVVIWLCVAPVQYFLFGNVPIYGLLLGILLSPIIEATTITGYISLVIFALIPPVGQVVAYFPAMLVSLILFMSRCFT